MGYIEHDGIVKQSDSITYSDKHIMCEKWMLYQCNYYIWRKVITLSDLMRKL